MGKEFTFGNVRGYAEDDRKSKFSKNDKLFGSKRLPDRKLLLREYCAKVGTMPILVTRNRKNTSISSSLYKYKMVSGMKKLVEQWEAYNRIDFPSRMPLSKLRNKLKRAKCTNEIEGAKLCAEICDSIEETLPYNEILDAIISQARIYYKRIGDLEMENGLLPSALVTLSILLEEYMAYMLTPNSEIYEQENQASQDGAYYEINTSLKST